MCVVLVGGSEFGGMVFRDSGLHMLDVTDTITQHTTTHTTKYTTQNDTTPHTTHHLA